MSEHPDWLTDMLIHEETLRLAGIVEPDQPTEGQHILYMMNLQRRRYRDFTKEERGVIRERLGLWP